MKILCICTANHCRSITLAAMLNATPGMEARSAGTHPGRLGHAITEADLRWADWIMVFEMFHVKAIKLRFRKIYRHLTVINLDVPDDYMPHDPALIEWLQTTFMDRFKIELHAPKGQP